MKKYLIIFLGAVLIFSMGLLSPKVEAQGDVVRPPTVGECLMAKSLDDCTACLATTNMPKGFECTLQCHSDLKGELTCRFVPSLRSLAK